MSDQERKNKRIGAITSAGIHLALFLAFFFLMAWRAPNPPNPEFGIELNFGLDDQGSGEVQPETTVGSETDTKSETVEEQSQAQQEEIKDEVKEEVEKVKEKPVEQVDSKTESPVVVKEEKKKEVKTETKEKPAEAKEEKVIAEYKTGKKTDANTKDASKKGDAGNQGDDKNKTGDKGSEEGKLDAKALYGTPGGGGGGNGFGLSMSGWKWEVEPVVPDITDEESGKVVFDIVCDENGDIIGITTGERSLSPKTIQLLKDAIRKSSLRKDSDGKAQTQSTGKITFVLKTR